MKKYNLAWFLDVSAFPTRVNTLKKLLYQRFVMDISSQKTLIFIVGCQRSGTTMLSRTFQRDLRTKIYGELGLSEQNSRRLMPHNKIEQLVLQDLPPVIVAKPLLDSQNIRELLNYFSGAKAVWIYRNYKDVTRSRVKRFSDEGTRKNLAAVIGLRQDRQWMSENASEQVKNVVRRYYSETMSPQDANALYWYVRNSLFFDLSLEYHPKVMLLKYDDLALSPINVMRNVYRFCDVAYPGDYIVNHIHNQSIGLGKDVGISRDIADICDALWQNMNRVHKATRLLATP
ncbi:MAG: sulfotransferase domain-containing protein [Anaerolineae bacterium]|nr:sulfotransferase domain-containing protein [Anaerolineae bacterium]MCB0213796.1 sulfotransferase domain-containing protein [Anaerolineae bacterium]